MNEGHPAPGITSTSDTAQRGGRAARRIAVLLVIGIVGAFVIPIGIIAAFGPSMAQSTVPRFSVTVDKLRRADLMRAYRVQPDSSIDPMRAGEAFHSLGNRTGYRLPAGVRPATHGPFVLPAADTSLFRGAGPRAWAGPSALRILELAHKGFSRAELDYLALLARNPLWDDYAIVAHAPRMDLAGATYVLPFGPNASPFEPAVARFAATKELAYASTARAAWHLANKRPADAEQALREVVSNGFRLVDDGNSLIDELIGVVVVGIGRSGLEQLYAITGNAELARLRAASDAFDRARAPAPASSTPESASLPEAIADSTRPRGLRFELATSSSVSACANVRQMVFGRPETLTTALATARHQIARTEAEGALFDLNAQAIERPLRRLQADAATGVGPRAIVWSAKVPAFLLRNPRISNCAALVATSLRGS